MFMSIYNVWTQQAIDKHRQTDRTVPAYRMKRTQVRD